VHNVKPGEVKLADLKPGAVDPGAVNLGIRARTFLVSLGLIGAALIASEVYLSHVLEERLTEHVRADLQVRAQLVAQRVSATPRALETAAVADALADEMSRVSGVRVTLLRKDGTVAGDSEVEPRALGDMENHASRPEIAQALASGRGSSVRYSTTVRDRMMYVAVPVTRDGETIGSARVALALNQLEELTGDMQQTLAIAALLALLVAAVLSLAAAHLTSRKVRELTEVAHQMATGNLAVRTHVEGSDEIVALGRALDQLAVSLSRTLDALRGERDLVSGILSSMHEGVLFIGADRRIALTNPALRAMLLLGPDAVGKYVLQVVRNAQLNELLERAWQGQSPETELQLSGLLPRRVLVRAVTIQGERGGVLAVFVDVTELRRLEAVRRDFVASASHELKSPLTAVRAAAETLHSVKDEPRAAGRFIEIIQRNAERLDNLVNDMLELSRVEMREMKLQLEPVPLAGVVERLVSQHVHRAEAKDIVLSFDIPGGLQVRADRRALEHVLVNLVDNALKYCPRGCSIGIEAAPAARMVRVSVADNGPGIPAEHLPRLFERFYRVDPGRSRELGGTGLGLSIVKHLVEAMGGTVTAESRPGAGAVFSFTLQQA
jgi:two-component system, OmpR family, phosphate regulon sensor histidine kinase PhoR